MRPQDDEPCVNCKNWSNRNGCKLGQYDSAAMCIFGYCGHHEPKVKKGAKKGEGE